MDLEAKKELEKVSKELVPELQAFFKNVFPSKRIDSIDHKELSQRWVDYIEYLEELENEKDKKKYNVREIILKAYEKMGIDINEDEIKAHIDTFKPSVILEDDYGKTMAKDYILFMNNFVEASFVKKKLIKILNFAGNPDLPGSMGLTQFIGIELEDTMNFLFKKPFRFDPKTATKLKKIYANLSGYYEIFVKIMILVHEIVLFDKEVTEEDYQKLSTMPFGNILKLTYKIPDFEIFRTPFNIELRNKITHKESYIDFNKKKIVFPSKNAIGEVNLSEVLSSARNLIFIIFAYNVMYVLGNRKILQCIYTSFIANSWDLIDFCQ